MNLLLGRARTGKTKWIFSEIKRKMSEGETGMLLIVPEQYSHDAERELCSVCGDSLSLHAEVLSFTRLCEHVFSETGCENKRILDKSGQILVMHKALEAVSADLKVFGIRKMRTEMLKMLIEAVKEFKTLCISADKLAEIAAQMQKPLSDKLHDIALIMGAYDALLELYGNDASERLTLLAKYIATGSVGSKGHIYFDGFSDFTQQEMLVIKELIKKDAEITVCLTCDPDDYDMEIFHIPCRTIAQLHKIAGNKINIIKKDVKTTASDITHIEQHLFDDVPAKYTKAANAKTECTKTGNASQAVKIFAAPSRYAECEYAAAKIWEMVKSGYRWRDIAVMARNWEDYETICESVFERYGIPYFSSGKVDIINKSPIALIEAALEIATAGWEYKSVFRYLKTGLLGISAQDIAVLENYVLMWKIRGSMWHKEWKMPPTGYTSKADDKKENKDNEKLLQHINSLREAVIKPVIALRESIKGDSSTGDKLRGLYAFLSDIKLPSVLLSKAEVLKKRSQLRLADEYRQLLDIVVDAIDQMYMILGECNVSEVEFRKLVTLVFSQHNVGVIPVSLDKTPLGSMTMSRRRDLKCLIILGATDENLPALTQGSGLLSDNERVVLSEIDTKIPAGLQERLYREMNMLYLTLTLPTEGLIMIYCRADGSRPSFLVSRLCEMFDITAETMSEEQYMSAAQVPYFELLDREKNQNELSNRENLTKEAALLLYGKDTSLSATQVGRFYSCRFMHFLQNGLRINPRSKAEFDAASAGNFMHYVLEGVFGEIEKGEGFKNVDDKLCSELTAKYASKFISEKLHDFEGRDMRFIYLFKRYEETVVHVVRDMIDEMASSGFVPVRFEMNISELSSTRRGYIDRTDSFELDNRLYMRVIDYKTRKSAYSFDLSDVLYGRDMQMLIYLSALKKYGKQYFGKVVEPAGVLYAPTRDVIISTSRSATDEQIESLRLESMRRSGLLLNDPDIIEAMESGESKKFLPLKTSKDGSFAGDSLVSDKRFELLLEHVDIMMERASEAILNGDNDCRPYYRNAGDNACTYCEYFAVCRFDEQMGDTRFYQSKLKPGEVWEKLEEKS